LPPRPPTHKPHRNLKNLPLELELHSHRGHATCLLVIDRNVATLLTADLHPMGIAEIWIGSHISASITTKIHTITDENGCPAEEQPFPPTTIILQKLVPLWEHSIHEWAQILGRGLYGRPYFLDDRELQWANPTLRTPLPQTFQAALTYLFRALSASTDPAHWDKLKRSIKITPLWDLPIAPRWRLILNEDCTTIPDTPSSLALDRATRQHSIKSALTRHPRDTTEKNAVQIPKLTLHFPSPRRRKVDKRRADLKRASSRQRRQWRKRKHQPRP
jgi:hypothetical protein